MECNFVVGQKVVCINDDKDFGVIPFVKYENNTLDGLTRGEIYTITEIYACPVTKSGIAISLKEISRSTINSLKLDRGFDYRRFAPLKEKKTDISVFTEIVNKINNGNHDNDYNFNLDELFETVRK